MQSHTCTKCGTTKNIEEFYKSKYNRSGYRGTCKSCVQALNRSRVRRYADKKQKYNGSNSLPSVSELKLNFKYNDDGSLTRLTSCGSEKAGSITFGSKDSKGYRRVAFNGISYRLHRINWKINYNEEPEELDHINKDPSDNRIENLRPSNRKMNCKNLSMRAVNSSGFFGVHRDRQRKKWVAQITSDMQWYNLGRFSNIKDAVLAYNEKCNELHGEFGKSKIIHNMEELKRRGLI